MSPLRLLALFALYAAMLAPSIYLGDSGDMVVAAWHLDIAHPTGYPLYALVGKLATFLPLGDVAFRLNLLSALCGVGTIALLAGFLRKVGYGRGAGMAALLFALSPSFWHEALIARVYTLNLLVTILALRAATTSLVLAFFLVGVGMGNHFMVVLAIPAILVLHVAREGWRGIDLRRLVLATTFFLLGFSLYLYLPIRSHFGQIPQGRGDPASWGAFLDVLLRRAYWKNAYVADVQTFARAALDFVTGFGDEFGMFGALLVVVGLGEALSRRLPLALALLALIGGNFLLMADHGSAYDLFETHRYYLTAWLSGSLLLGIGAHVGCRAAEARLRPGFFRLLLLLLGMLLLLPQVLRAPSFLREAFFPRDYGFDLLLPLPQETVLIVEGDNETTLCGYLVHVERFRSDVTVAEGPYLDRAWHRRRLPPDLRGFSPLPDGRSGLYLHARAHGYPVATTKGDPAALPFGLVHLLPGIRPPPGREQEIYRNFREVAIPSGHEDPLITAVSDRFALLARRRGDAALLAGNPGAAVHFYEASLRFSPTRGRVWQNLALALSRLGAPTEALRVVTRGLEEEPTNPEMLLARVLLLIEVGREEEAAAALSRAERFAPSDPDFLTRLEAARTILRPHPEKR